MGLEQLHSMNLEDVPDGSGRLKIPTNGAESMPRNRKLRGVKTHLIIDFGYREGSTGGFNLDSAITTISILSNEPVVWVDQKRVKMRTAKDHALLAFLAEREGVAIPNEKLQKKLWGSKSNTTGNIRTALWYLRLILGEDATNPAVIKKPITQRSSRFGDFDPTRYYNAETGEVTGSRQIEMFGGRMIFYPDSRGIIIDDRVVELTKDEAKLMTVLTVNH